MANNLNSPNAEEAMNLKERVQEVRRGLEKELEYRKATNAAGSSCSSPPMRTTSALCEKLASCVNNYTSTRKPNPGSCFPSPGRRGLSSSPSASSDSSICGSVSGFLCTNSRDVERNNLATVRVPTAASARPSYGRGSSSDRVAARVTQPRVLGQEVVEQMPNSSKPSSSAPTSGRGKTGVVSPSTPTGGAPQARVPKKRKRLSKKPPTTNVDATVEEFLATVQKLTGCKQLPAPVVRPQPTRPQPDRAQPERPQANAVPIDVGLDSCNPPPAGPGSSSTSMMSAVHSPSPTVSNRVPEATFSIRESSTAGSSSSKSSDLNDCMGYGRSTPHFLEEQGYDENLGQLPDDSLQPASDSVTRYISEPMEYKKHEVSTTAASSTGASVQEGAPLPSDSNGKEGILMREHAFVGSNMIDPVYYSPISHDFTRPPPVSVFNHRPVDMDRFEMEFDNEWLANAFLSDYQ